jgi:hypothetical protein
MQATYTTIITKDDEKNATGIPVPAEVIAALGQGKRPKVIVTVGGHSYRSTVAAYGDVYMLPLSQEHRAAAGVEGGQTVEITLELDTQPRTVDVPDDLVAALAERPGRRAAFDALSYTARKEHVRQVETAKAAETRQRRIDKIVAGLDGG